MSKTAPDTATAIFFIDFHLLLPLSFTISLTKFEF